MSLKNIGKKNDKPNGWANNPVSGGLGLLQNQTSSRVNCEILIGWRGNQIISFISVWKLLPSRRILKPYNNNNELKRIIYVS